MQPCLTPENQQRQSNIYIKHKHDSTLHHVPPATGRARGRTHPARQQARDSCVGDRQSAGLPRATVMTTRHFVAPETGRNTDVRRRAGMCRQTVKCVISLVMTDYY